MSNYQKMTYIAKMVKELSKFRNCKEMLTSREKAHSRMMQEVSSNQLLLADNMEQFQIKQFTLLNIYEIETVLLCLHNLKNT